ncbi:hypothetical protein [Acidisoma sp. C75]
MITQTGLFCAAAALIAALYSHATMRLAVWLKRKFHLPRMGLAMLPIAGLTIGLLYLAFLLLQSFYARAVGSIGSATFLGLIIGRFVPAPGLRGSGLGFGGDSSFADESGEAGDEGSDDDGDGGH